jgi:cation-transporting ATPase 13A3/4/5
MLELAVSGSDAIAKLEESGDLHRLLMFIRIFARASPENKAKVVQAFVDYGLVVGMCGDGGNDCGALRAAHAGVALSDAEASIVAPFTAKTKSCAAVVQLLKEGRCALHTNLATYRFLMIYGQLFGVWKVTS